MSLSFKKIKDPSVYCAENRLAGGKRLTMRETRKAASTIIQTRGKKKKKKHHTAKQIYVYKSWK